MLKSIKSSSCIRKLTCNTDVHEAEDENENHKRRETDIGILGSKDSYGKGVKPHDYHFTNRIGSKGRLEHERRTLPNLTTTESLGREGNMCNTAFTREIDSSGEDDLVVQRSSTVPYKSTQSRKSDEHLDNNLPNSILKNNTLVEHDQVQGRLQTSLFGPTDQDVQWQHPKESDENATREKYETLKLKCSEQNIMIVQLEEKLMSEQREKENLLTRLSRYTSNQLADNNPNIADLGDVNRPTKLAEKFAELYDNEWTEAFEFITKDVGLDEEKAIKELLQALQKIFDVCQTESSSRIEQATKSIQELTMQKENYELIRRSIKEFKEERKHNYKAFLPQLHKKIESAMSSSLTVRNLLYTVYVTKATELCWLMSIQDPPMTLCFKGQKGKRFDDTLFRPYTDTGKYTDFVVWPALLLTDGGSILSKGVAQGRKGKKKKNTSMKRKDQFTAADNAYQHEIEKSSQNDKEKNDHFSGGLKDPINDLSHVHGLRQKNVQTAEETNETFEQN